MRPDEPLKIRGRRGRRAGALPDRPFDRGNRDPRGHVMRFANNPIWRGETIGSYAMVFNTILNFDSLDAGRKLDPR